MQRCLRSVLCAGPVLACRGQTSGDEKAKHEASLAREPERFEFVLPSDYVPLELRGEGSEVLRAPAGAHSSAIDGGFRIESGQDFAIDVRPFGVSFEMVVSRIEPTARKFEDHDTVVFAAPSGLAFVVRRELVPEWDEGDRRTIACSSAGVSLDGNATPAGALRFTRGAVEKMVAACRSLELPKLE
jgi:hypothetical protein